MASSLHGLGVPKEIFSDTSLLSLADAKGQFISKGLFGILNSSKKQMKEFDLTTIIPQVDLFSFVFWKYLEHTKKTFRN